MSLGLLLSSSNISLEEEQKKFCSLVPPFDGRAHDGTLKAFQTMFGASLKLQEEL
jgi:hypothetical protein